MDNDLHIDITQGCLPVVNAINTINIEEVDKILATLREVILSSQHSLKKPESAEGLSSQIEGFIGKTNSISTKGIGVDLALELFTSLLIKQGIPTNHSGFLSYVGVSPTPASALMDGLISASGMIGSAWFGGAGLVWAENQVLSWLAELAGLPEHSGGCFVSGGTAGNLSALAAARSSFREINPDTKENIVLVGESAHASIHNCAHLLDLSIVTVPCDDTGRVTAPILESLFKKLLDNNQLNKVVAVVASAGSTNSGQIDDLLGIGQLAKTHNLWFHVDGAYGGSFLCIPELKPLFKGIELANSIIIDPHKGLFAPYDCCALIYSEPKTVTSAFSQDAAYLEHMNASPDWNPMHYALHLTRRPRGIPLWFSLAVYGSHAYTESLRKLLVTTQTIKQKIIECEKLELIEHTNLSVILFKRIGWDTQQYYRWSDQCLKEGIVFVVPTKWREKTVVRLCIMTTQLETQRIDAMLLSLL